MTRLVTDGSAAGASGARAGQLSPRLKGVLQGVAIVPGGVGAWLVLDIIYEGLFNAGIMGGLYAMFTLILLVALARILYAVFFEEGSTRRAADSATSSYAGRGEVAAPETKAALSPGAGSEMGTPLNITEKTTRQFGERG
ncbi:MAG TPA: hypothetical protein VEQ42_11060 [Pyrinomonadaceae bacterium]|nr:hypothetical protein [Pyrinomonadaceae bacterium]